MRTYLYGYNSWQRRVTLSELDKIWAWNRLHPEFRRRLLALMNASQDAGREVGIGGGARSASQQQQVFLERHEQVRVGGCCSFQGQRYRLRKGAAHAAPPGRSYHEDDAYQGFGVAADLIGDLRWMKSQAESFGFREFSDKNEAWHVQPKEFADARSRNGNRHLSLWPLPGPVNDPRPVRPVLRARVVGPDVAVLQRALNALMGANLKVDGAMGTQGETIKAVSQWQQFFQLPVTGVVDEVTWRSVYDIADLRGYRVI